MIIERARRQMNGMQLAERVPVLLSRAETAT